MVVNETMILLGSLDPGIEHTLQSYSDGRGDRPDICPPTLISHLLRDAGWEDAGHSFSGTAGCLVRRGAPAAELSMCWPAGYRARQHPLPPHPTGPRMSEVLCMVVHALLEDHSSLSDCEGMYHGPLMEDK